MLACKAGRAYSEEAVNVEARRSIHVPNFSLISEKAGEGTGQPGTH